MFCRKETCVFSIHNNKKTSNFGKIDIPFFSF